MIMSQNESNVDSINDAQLAKKLSSAKWSTRVAFL